jgi:acyl-CoA synthetase (AMP-forming)/AMP-acid ligase II
MVEVDQVDLGDLENLANIVDTIKQHAAVAPKRPAIVDDRGQPDALGTIGLQRCKCSTVAPGFCSTNSETAGESFEDGWYYPGETVKIDVDGFIYLVGRSSAIILRGGSDVNTVPV